MNRTLGNDHDAEGYNTGSGSGYPSGPSNRLEDISPLPANVFEALGRWSDAVKLMAPKMDRDACASLLEEIAALQDDTASRRCVTPSIALRAFIDCPLPELCTRVVGNLERCAESEMPFAEHVSTILDDFVCIQDPACTGKQDLAEALAAKNRELKDLSLQLDAHVREREKVKSEQQELTEEERIQKALKEVRLKAAQQRVILESSLEKNGHSIQPMQTEEENDVPSRDVDMSGPSAQAVNTERQQDKARSVVLAIQEHINLVYSTADFVKEARSCMGSLVHSMMVKTLQDELETLSQDQEHAEFLRNQLKEPQTATASSSNQRVVLSSSITRRYKSFYIAQFRNMTARHVLSRYAAEGLIAYLTSRDQDNQQLDTTADTAAQQDSQIADLARQIIDKLDGLGDIALPDDQPSEVPSTARDSTLVLCGGSFENQHQSGVIAALQCASALGELARRPSIAGRLTVRSPVVPEERLAQTCSLVLALGGLGMVPSDLAADVEKDFLSAALVVSEALDFVLSGKSRNSVCVLSSKVARIENTGTNDKVPANNLHDSMLLSSVVAALLQGKITFQWLSKIAVVDLLGCFERPNTILNGAGVRFFPVDCGEGGNAVATVDQRASQGEAATGREARCTKWRTNVEAVNVQIAEYVPDLIIVCYRFRRGSLSESSGAGPDCKLLLARSLDSEDWIWSGKCLSKLAGRLCRGRLVTVWDLAGGAQLWHGSVSDMTFGMLNPSE